MIRPTVAQVDLGAIKRNFRNIAAYLASDEAAGGVRDPGIVRVDRARRPPPKVIAVVKANGYGNGAGQVARALEQAAADLLALADCVQGATLRAPVADAGIIVICPL